MKKWNLYAAAVLAAVGILGGCGAKNAETQAQPQNAQASTQENTEAESTQAESTTSKRSRVQSRNREKWYFICDLCKIPVKCAKYRRAGPGDLCQCIWSNGL